MARSIALDGVPLEVALEERVTVCEDVYVFPMRVRTADDLVAGEGVIVVYRDGKWLRMKDCYVSVTLKAGVRGTISDWECDFPNGLRGGQALHNVGWANGSGDQKLNLTFKPGHRIGTFDCAFDE